MSKRLYVGGLPYKMDDDALRKLIEEGDGSVAGAGADTVKPGETKVMRDRLTQESRGFGFIEMTSVEAADNVIKLFNGLVYERRTLKVDKARDRQSSSFKPRNKDTNFKPRYAKEGHKSNYSNYDNEGDSY